jgi:soluble lytic murein transglycosylase-like protein
MSPERLSNYKDSRSLARLIILISGIFLVSNIPAVQAESYLRVRKNGVIYYYFSMRGEHKANDQRRPVRKFRTQRLPPLDKSSAQNLEPIIQEASRRYNLPSSLVKAVIRVESNFNPAATSSKGAQGLMQLIPETAAQLRVSNPYDIRQNIWAGTRYLGMLLQKFNNRLHLALAAYNAGPQRVEKCQTVPPIKETQDYVRDVCANFLAYTKEEPPAEEGKPNSRDNRPKIGAASKSYGGVGRFEKF